MYGTETVFFVLVHGVRITEAQHSKAVSEGAVTSFHINAVWKKWILSVIS